MNKSLTDTVKSQAAVRYGYALLLFLLTLTGFAQMPIMKRYYIADIPGLGWLADFYITHALHYIGSIFFLGLLAYMIIDFLLLHRLNRKITRLGYSAGLLLVMIISSGMLLVINNFAGIYFPKGFIIFLDLCHLGSVMGFLAVSLFGVVFKKRWTTSI
jgi:hypothetical protein